MDHDKAIILMGGDHVSWSQDHVSAAGREEAIEHGGGDGGSVLHCEGREGGREGAEGEFTSEGTRGGQETTGGEREIYIYVQ